MKTRCGLKTSVIVLGICLLQAGVQCFQWHLKPPSQTTVESGKNVTISWGYTLDQGEKRNQLEIYLNKNDDENTIATIINHNTYKGKAYNYKTMITSQDSIVSMTLFFVDRQNIRQDYCTSFSGFRGRVAIHKFSCTSLLVYERPRITHHTPNIIANIRSIVELKCNASGDPKPSIVWMKMGADKTPRHYSHSSTTTFKITTRETLGKYCCLAANKYGNDTTCTNVSIGVNTLARCNKKNTRSAACDSATSVTLGVLFGGTLISNFLLVAYIIFWHRKLGNKQDTKARSMKDKDEVVPMNTMSLQDSQNMIKHEPTDYNRKQQSPNTTIYQSVNAHSDIYSSLSPTTRLPPKPAVMPTRGVSKNEYCGRSLKPRT